MADEYEQPQLHRHHEAEEKEGEKRECFNESNNATAFVTASDADMATTETNDRGLFGKTDETEKKGEDEVEKKPLAYDTIDNVVGDETGVEAKDRGLFGNFMGKKKADEDEANTMTTELEKMSVSEPEEKKGNEFKEEHKENENKLHKSNSSSSGSSSDEEEVGEGAEKKNKKKGLKEKIKDMVSGGEKDQKEEDGKTTLDKEAAYIKPAEEVNVEPSYDQAEKKMDLMDEIKEKLPVSGENGNTENAHPSSLPVAEDTATKEAEPKEKLPVSGETGNTNKAHPSSLPVAEETVTQEDEPKEKKGILEKIKEKLPGYQTKTTET